MIKDRDVLPIAPTTPQATVQESDLYDATSNCLQECTSTTLDEAQAALLAAKGWYFDLKPGEKVVGAATTISGILFFNTNQPSSTACASTLGIAREYEVSYADATAVRDLKVDGVLTDDDRSSEHAGGGLLPEPVPILVEINNENFQGVSRVRRCARSTHCPSAPGCGRTGTNRSIDAVGVGPCLVREARAHTSKRWASRSPRSV